MLIPLNACSTDQLKELFKKSNAYQIQPSYMTEGIYVVIRSDESGMFLLAGDKEYRQDKDFGSGIYDQPFYCFFKLAESQGIENAECVMFFTYQETGTNQVIQLAGDKISDGVVQSFIYTSPDGVTLYKHNALVRWQVIQTKSLPGDKVFGDFRVRTKIIDVLDWLVDNEEMVNLDLTRNHDVTKEERQKVRDELTEKLNEICVLVTEVMEPELLHFKKKTKQEGKIIARSDTLIVDFKIQEDFEDAKQQTSGSLQELSSIYTEQLERIFGLFDFGKNKADITRTIKKQFGGDIEDFIKQYVKTTNPIGLRNKTIAILEYLIKALKEKLDASRAIDDKTKLYSAFFANRTNRLLKKLKKTTDKNEIVDSIISHVLFQ